MCRKTTANLSYKEALSSNSIEAGVLPLTDALNKVKFKTIASCEGHFYSKTFSRKNLVVCHPYVLFNAEVCDVRKLAQFLGNGSGIDNSLNYCWTLKGHFEPDDFKKLIWVIEAEDSRIPAQWERNKVDHDFIVLAEYVKTIKTVSQEDTAQQK